MLGLRYGQGSVSSQGCANAPGILRGLTAGLNVADEVWDHATDRRLPRSPPISDAGDFTHRAAIPRLAYFDTVARQVEDWTAAGHVVFAVGGDHSVTLAVAGGVAAALPALQIVQLDAHHDYTEVAAGAEPTHSNFVSFIAENDKVRQILQVGVRGLSSFRPRRPSKVVHSSMDKLAEALLPGVPVYLTIDTDAFDPRLAPATGHPVPEGLAWTDLIDVVRLCFADGRRIAGLDWTEYDPERDGPGYFTGLAIARAMTRLLSAAGEYWLEDEERWR